MSFYFTKQKTKAKAVKGQRTAPATKQNAAILHRLGCSACPLNKADVCTPKMQPTLADETLVYFLGEAPNRDEDENGTPLKNSDVGGLLRDCIPKGDRAFCSYDYVVRDHTPNGRPVTWQELESCRQYVTKSIEQAKPKLIIGLGKAPLTWALGSHDIDGMRGRVFAIQAGTHQCWFMPVFDPDFLLRKAFNKAKPLQSKLGHAFRMDIKRAFNLINTLPPARVDTEAEARAGVACFTGAEGAEPVLALLQKASQAPMKAVDIETSTLRPYALNARLLTVAISFGDVNFSFAVDHPKAKWQPKDKLRIMSELRELLIDDTIKIAHNAPFELEWFIKQFGPTVVNHWAWECTMMQAHFLDERRGKAAGNNENDSRRATYQSLDFLCKQYFGLAYKKLFKLPKADMASADLGETLLYNGVDTKYTLRLFKHQTKLLQQLGLHAAYIEALPRQPTVALMQHMGIDVDQGEIKIVQGALNEEIEGIIDEINSLKVVQSYIKDHRVFNPMSGPDTINIFRDYLKRPEIYVTDKSGKERQSTDKNVLDKIDHPLAELLIRLRNRSKLKSTYVDCFELGKGAFIWPDGKLHTSFNTTFTVTGRTSSDEPNQQNWPNRADKWVRKPVKPKKGNVLLAFDYGQLEACTAAMCSRDKVLVKALWEDYDIHMEWTHKLVDKFPQFLEGSDSIKDKPTAKRYRSIVKNKLVFPAIFGASNGSIAGYLNTPEDKVEELMEEFWRTFSDLKDWQDKLMKGYYNDGFVTSPTGRRHNYPLTRNEAINFPIQSVAADIVCDAMNVLSAEAAATKNWWLHPILNIHDDLTMVVPDDDAVLDDAIRRIYKVMLTPAFDFINVPMSVECSIGNNWYEMTEVGKFWSHKDL